MANKVYLDPGHGGHDPGAVANGLKEKDLVLSIARYAQSYLEDHYKNVSVRMSRNSDIFRTLSWRANDANRWGADAFVSIHINAGGGVGYEDYIYNGGVSRLTHKLQDAVHSQVAPLFFRNRGQKRANYYVVRNTNMPALLTENGFVDSRRDANFLSNQSNLRKIGEAHAKGIASYLGLSEKSSGGSKSLSSTAVVSGSGGEIYRVRNAWGNIDSQKGAFKNLENAKRMADRYRYNVYNSQGKVVYYGRTIIKPQATLKIDGKWGPATTRALQRYFGLTIDGVLSGQPYNSVTKALYGGVEWGKNGSPTVKSLQRKVGAVVDGKLGPQTVRQLQRYLKTPMDGVLSRPRSTVVVEMQRELNGGTF